MKALAGSLSLWLVLSIAPTWAESSQIEKLNSIAGSNLRAILAAMPEASKVMTDLEEYDVGVWRREGKIVVSFLDRLRDPGVRGSAGQVPEFAVHLAEGELQFVALYYQR